MSAIVCQKWTQILNKSKQADIYLVQNKRIETQIKLNKSRIYCYKNIKQNAQQKILFLFRTDENASQI